MTDTPNEHQNNDHSRPHLDTAWSPVADAMRHDRQSPKTKRGNPIDPKDPGSLGTRLLAILFAIALVSSVVVWQNPSEDFKFTKLLGKSPPPIELRPDQNAPGSFGQVDLLGRVYLRGFEMFQTQPVMSMIDNGSVPFADEDRIRLIMLAGEFEDDESAMVRINELQGDLVDKSLDPLNPEEADDLILAELRSLKTLYTIGIEALEEDQREQLIARYGLIAKVALTHGLDNTDPLREPLISGGKNILFFGLFAVVGTVFFLFAGMCLFVLGVVNYASGRMKMRNHVPTKGGSVFLETYALFVGAFLVMSVATFFVANSSRPELASLSLLAQWLLLLTVLWGVIRGMPFDQWRRAIGWHAGEGVLKEIGVGIIAYIASLPIYLLGVLVTMILLIISETIKAIQNNGAPAEPVSVTNPIFEIIASGDFVTIAMLFVLATTWAPIVEEAIFRGALFRHLRGYMHWTLAAMLSAFLFAYMHDYGPLLVAPLIALGFMFAFMREWRGSLIAPMTAHFLHNFTLISFMIILVQLIKDPM